MTSEAVPPDQSAPTSMPPPEVWVDRFADLLFAAARRRVGNRSICEELVQETLLSALKAKDSFGGQCEFSSWLVGILKHKILDHLRQVYRKSTQSLADDDEVEKIFESAGKWRHMPRRWHINPQDAAMESELEQMLSLCLDALPDQQRNAFVLSVMDEGDSAEVCNILGVSATNLYVLLHRARLRLRNCLEKKGVGATEK